jgi:hypothetical protein
MLFLIDYDRKAGKIVTMRTFDDAQRREAYEARFALELSRHRDGSDHEVVLLEAADEHVIRKTHRRYFADLTELAKLPAAG